MQKQNFENQQQHQQQQQQKQRTIERLELEILMHLRQVTTT
jgi:hypothetical protein